MPGLYLPVDQRDGHVGHFGQRRLVRDDDDRGRRQRLPQALRDEALGIVVEGGGRLVENEHRRAAQQCAGKGDAVPLAGGQCKAAFASACVQTFGQPGDQRSETGEARRFGNFGVRCIWTGKGDVVGQAIVEQVRCLVDQDYRAPQVVELQRAQVGAIGGDSAVIGIEVADHEVGHARLSGAARAKHGAKSAGRNEQVDAVENGPSIMAESNLLEAKAFVQSVEGPGVLALGHVRLGIEQCEDPAERDAGRCQPRNQPH